MPARRHIALRIAAMLCLLAGAAPRSPLPPRDECAADRSFAAYRERLRTAVARRDARALLALVSPGIMIDLGGGAGKQAFAETWQLDKGSRSPVWRELETLLRLGCARSDGTMSMPYFFQHLPQDADVVQQLMIIGSNVPLRAEPDDDARALVRLSWELVESIGAADMTAPWVKVSAHGHTGYVTQTSIRQLLDYRAVFNPAPAGGWTLVALVAGD